MNEPHEAPLSVEKPSAPSHPRLWLLRALNAVALGVSGYLAWLALTGRTAAGCGGAGGMSCERVLSSRWSYVLDVPVSIPAVSLWLTVLGVSLFAGQTRLLSLRRSAWLLLTLLTTAAAGAAGWFIGLQAFQLHHWCLYCVVAHGCAVLAWLLVLTRRELPSSAKMNALVAGLCLAAMLPLAQTWFPRASYYNLHVAEDVRVDAPTLLEGFGPSANAPYMDVLGGAARVNIADAPRIGDAEAKFVVVSLYDYACSHCRALHRELLAAQQEYDGQLTVVMLPTPLSHHCNPHITEKQSTSPDSCEVAELALIVAHLQPTQFAEYDAWLFETEEPRTLDEAYKQAAKIVGQDLLTQAEQNPRYRAILQQHIELYHASPAKLLPQIMGRNVILSEGVESTAELLEALEEEFGFKP